jgi:hypothetical protein
MRERLYVTYIEKKNLWRNKNLSLCSRLSDDLTSSTRRDRVIFLLNLCALVLLSWLSEITRDTRSLARIERVNLFSLVISSLFWKPWACREADENRAFQRRWACFLAYYCARGRKEQHASETEWAIHMNRPGLRQWALGDEKGTPPSLYDRCAFAWLGCSRPWSDFHATLDVSWRLGTTNKSYFDGKKK